jgi:hypothetical protein
MNIMEIQGFEMSTKKDTYGNTNMDGNGKG